MKTTYLCIFVGIISMLVAISCAAPQASTQKSADPSSPETRQRTPEQLTVQISARLELTAEQETQIWPIIEEQAAQMRALFEKYHGQGRDGMSSLRKEMQQLQSDTEYRLAEFLTDAQLQEFQKMMEEQQQFPNGQTGRSGNVGKRGGGMGGL